MILYTAKMAEMIEMPFGGEGVVGRFSQGIIYYIGYIY